MGADLGRAKKPLGPIEKVAQGPTTECPNEVLLTYGKNHSHRSWPLAHWVPLLGHRSSYPRPATSQGLCLTRKHL